MSGLTKVIRSRRLSVSPHRAHSRGKRFASRRFRHFFVPEPVSNLIKFPIYCQCCFVVCALRKHPCARALSEAGGQYRINIASRYAIPFRRQNGIVVLSIKAQPRSLLRKRFIRRSKATAMQNRIAFWQQRPYRHPPHPGQGRCFCPPLSENTPSRQSFLKRQHAEMAEQNFQTD